MVKSFDLSKLDEVMKIWLESNITAHSFIPEQFWEDNFDTVKKLLPQAEIWVYEDKEAIKGFIGILNQSYIAGLFVSNQYQSKGIGSKLIEKCKQLHPVLCLDVYVKNQKAIRFYKRHGFKIEQEKENSLTGEKEYFMRRSKA